MSEQEEKHLRPVLERFVYKNAHKPQVILQAIAKSASRFQLTKVQLYLEFIHEYDIVINWNEPVKLKRILGGECKSHYGILSAITSKWSRSGVSLYPVENETEILKLLLDSRCDVFSTNQWGEYPCKYVKRKESVQLLLDQMKDKQTDPISLRKYMQIAVNTSNWEVCNVFLERGADFMVETENGSWPGFICHCLLGNYPYMCKENRKKLNLIPLAKTKLLPMLETVLSQDTCTIVFSYFTGMGG